MKNQKLLQLNWQIKHVFIQTQPPKDRELLFHIHIADGAAHK